MKAQKTCCCNPLRAWQQTDDGRPSFFLVGLHRECMNWVPCAIDGGIATILRQHGALATPSTVSMVHALKGGGPLKLRDGSIGQEGSPNCVIFKHWKCLGFLSEQENIRRCDAFLLVRSQGSHRHKRIQMRGFSRSLVSAAAGFIFLGSSHARSGYSPGMDAEQV